MKDAPHPYRHDDRPAKSEIRYWPLPGQRTLSLVWLMVLVGLTVWATIRMLGTVGRRLDCGRAQAHATATCTLYEIRPTKDPRVLWEVDAILSAMGPPTNDGIGIMLDGPEDKADVLRYGTLPITDAALAKEAYDFIRDESATTMSSSEGDVSLLQAMLPVALGLWALVVLLRLPRPVVFTIDVDRGMLTARFGTLVARHTTVIPLADIDRAEVVLVPPNHRRLTVVKKDGVNEIFEQDFRPGVHHHDVAAELNGAIARARRDVV